MPLVSTAISVVAAGQGPTIRLAACHHRHYRDTTGSCRHDCDPPECPDSHKLQALTCWYKHRYRLPTSTRATINNVKV
jgi:hypothetical protein